jgi:hypothetical protein
MEERAAGSSTGVFNRIKGSGLCIESCHSVILFVVECRKDQRG